MRVGLDFEESRDGREVQDLYRWLRMDTDLRQSAEIGLVSRPDAEAMGTLDIIELVIAQGIAALNLAVAYAAWRNTRPAAPRVTITYPGGSITVQDGSEETVRRIEAALRRAAAEDGESEDTGGGEAVQGASEPADGSRAAATDDA